MTFDIDITRCNIEVRSLVVTPYRWRHSVYHGDWVVTISISPGGRDAGDVIHGLPRWQTCDQRHITMWPWRRWRHSRSTTVTELWPTAYHQVTVTPVTSCTVYHQPVPHHSHVTRGRISDQSCCRRHFTRLSWDRWRHS